jgi:hypothetical protein
MSGLKYDGRATSAVTLYKFKHFSGELNKTYGFVGIIVPLLRLHRVTVLINS